MSAIKTNNLNDMAREIFSQNHRVGWWPQKYNLDGLSNDEKSEVNAFLMEKFGVEKFTELYSFRNRNHGEILCLIISEVIEGFEGLRKNLMDDHLKDRKMIEVELADAVIRILDNCGAYGYDIGGALAEKFEYNKTRADHKLENRMKEDGKRF